MAKVVFEKNFEEPVTDEQIDAMRANAEPCFEINGVTRLQTFVSPDRKRFICIFEAGDAESVRRAMESAGMAPYERVWAADKVF